MPLLRRLLTRLLVALRSNRVKKELARDLGQDRKSRFPRFSFPQPIQNLETFVHTFCAHLKVGCLADFGEPSIIRGSTHSYGENQPACRKLIHRHTLAGQLPRTSSRDRGNHGAEANSLCPRCDGTHDNPRVKERICSYGNPIRKKEAVPPCFFSLARKVDGGIESFGAIDATCISHGQLLARVMVRVWAFFD